MKTSSKIRLISWAILVSVACIGLLMKERFVAGLFMLSYLLLDWEEFKKPIPRQDLWPTLLGALLFLILIVSQCIFSWRPSAQEQILYLMNNPIVVLLLWLLFMYGIYNRWRKEMNNTKSALLPNEDEGII